MENQVQCPNCGGYKVVTETRRINPKTQKESTTTRGQYIAAYSIGSVFILLGIGTHYIFGIISGILVIALFILISILNKKMINKYYNACSLCGYKWSRLENEPEPQVVVRPDLMEKGDIELKRQQAGSAAAYHEQQRRNNK